MLRPATPNIGFKSNVVNPNHRSTHQGDRHGHNHKIEFCVHIGHVMHEQNSGERIHHGKKCRQPKSPFAVSPSKANVPACEDHRKQHQRCSACDDREQSNRPRATDFLFRHPVRRRGPGRDQMEINRLAAIRSGSDVNWSAIAFIRTLPIPLQIEWLNGKPLGRGRLKVTYVQTCLLEHFLPIGFGSCRLGLILRGNGTECVESPHRIQRYQHHA